MSSSKRGILAGLVLLVLVIISLVWSVRGKQGAPATPRPSTAWADSNKKSPPRQVTPSADKATGVPSPGNKSRVLGHWDEIRPEWALMPAAGARRSKTAGIEFSWIVEGLRVGRMRGGWTTEEVDALAREVGTLAAIDLAVLKQAGWEYEGTVEKDFQLPGGYASRAKEPGDPEKIRAALAELIVGEVGGAVDRIPETHRCDRVDLGVRCRAVAWLTALGPSPESSQILNKLLKTDGNPRLRGMAAAGLLMFGEDALVEQWADAEADHDTQIAFLAALQPLRGKAVFGGARINSTLGRWYDTAQDPEMRRVSAAAMASRSDDPYLRARVIGVLASDAPSDVKLAVIQQGGPLLDDETYRQTLLMAARTGDRRVALAALRHLGSVPNAETAQILIGRLESDDLHIARAAAEMLNMCGSASPRESQEALERALAKHGRDEAFEFYASSALNRLR